MQALVQKYTTHSISSTINLATDVSEDLVGNIYMESWKQGLKVLPFTGMVQEAAF